MGESYKPDSSVVLCGTTTKSPPHLPQIIAVVFMKTSLKCSRSRCLNGNPNSRVYGGSLTAAATTTTPVVLTENEGMTNAGGSRPYWPP